jgi:hypothetical protein
MLTWVEAEAVAMSQLQTKELPANARKKGETHRRLLACVKVTPMM